MTTELISMIRPAHIVAGMLALAAGYVALAATKGQPLHRRSGLFFVYAMMAMSLSGALMDAIKTARVSINVIAGLLTFYFVTTALLTVRPRRPASRTIDRAGAVLAIAVSLLAFGTGIDLAIRGRLEAPPSFMFGIVGLLAAIGDARLVRDGQIDGTRRLRRHLWRMCFAMWIAAASFFWGPPNRVPEAIRIPALQATAVLLPVGTMLYWLWRLRARSASRRVATVIAPEAI
jgi:uncharacterized membrane protein